MLPLYTEISDWFPKDWEIITTVNIPIHGIKSFKSNKRIVNRGLKKVLKSLDEINK